VRAFISITVVGLTLVAMLATTAGAQTESAPGVTKDAVKLGFIFSETGVASSLFSDSGKACQARVDRQNAAGGVNGRKIDLQLVDDASGGGNLTAAQDLVQNRNVFAVVNNSSFAFLTYRFLKGQGVPMIGGGFDGTYYGEKGNENILSGLGNLAPVDGLTYTTIPIVMKKLGATKTAAATYGASPSAVAAVKGFQNYGAPAVGLKPVYTNLAIDFGSTDVGPVVLGIKNSGANGAYLPFVESTNLAILQGLQQNGVTLKSAMLLTGYGQNILDSPVAKTLTPSTLIATPYVPVELKTKGTKQFQADLKKYAGYTGVPDYGQYTGYISCDMAIQGLKGAGANPTRQGFVDGFRKQGTYDQAGLACQPLPVGLDTFGKEPETNCSYFLSVKDGKFVIYNNGKPVIGKLVGDKDLVAQARSGAASAVTTTTSASPPAS
jgi:branched-chain amino acid transport system substrate-binding protein